MECVNNFFYKIDNYLKLIIICICFDMGFTIKDNVINVDQYGMRVKDLQNLKFDFRTKECESLKWKEGILRMRDLGKIKEYKVYFHNCEQTYLKPREKVNCSIFEEVFGFGKKCQGYDENKIVLINQP